MDIISVLSAEFSLDKSRVEQAVGLMDEGNTIPFIARYRKEATGSMDDQVLRELSLRLEYLRNLDEQRGKIRTTIDQQGALTEELSAALDSAKTLAELEDLYRPYRPKRKTRASVAKVKGLQPLADALLAQDKSSPPPEDLAAEYLSEEVPSVEEALQGARDIIAEHISDDAALRSKLRSVMLAGAMLRSEAAKDEDSVYAMYYDFREPVSKAAGYRILAVNRGEREGFLKAGIEFDREKALGIAYLLHVRDGAPSAGQVRAAAEDAYDRLIFPSMEREIRTLLTERASEDAMRVFSLNLRNLLLQPPLKGRTVLGLDPGYRTGCKAAVVDPTGKVLETGVIYPAPPHKKIDEAKKTVKRWIAKYGADVIAIGNGTASHETEVFAADTIRELDGAVSYMVVSEAGASVYSASKLAAEEFPEYDVSLRSAVSIARRLQDPLAELVKIDPKAIGVGQYQHDMPQARLAEALGGVVESCVNTVGVSLNTASAPLLAQVAGIGGAVAKNIVLYREENGAFTSRAQLKKVPKLGPKAFEQCAGFLRVPESKNLLDNTAVHPESYAVAKRLLERCGSAEDLKSEAERQCLPSLAKELEIGEPTLRDIISELTKPGRDPRDELPPPLLRTDVMSLEDLKPGMELTGTVRNVIDFGAFVDIGVHEDGLVHISQMSDRFIKHPSEVVKVGDLVNVRVLTVDSVKKRIGLTMKQEKK